MANNFGIREGYTARLTPAYFEDTMPDGKIWQPDVYEIAAQLARKLGCNTLIDIGCGRGHKLLPLMHRFKIIGVDTGDNIHYCQKMYSDHTWIDADLEQDVPDVFKDVRGAVVICADVIEHLINPQVLMLTLSRLAVCAGAVLLSTPDRGRVYGYDQDGPPSNPHHVREWMLPEMVEWLQMFPLRIAWAGWTRSNNVDPDKDTLLIAATREQSSYPVKIDDAFDVEVWKYA